MLLLIDSVILILLDQKLFKFQFQEIDPTTIHFRDVFGFRFFNITISAQITIKNYKFFLK